MVKPLLFFFVFLLFSASIVVDCVKPNSPEANIIYIRQDGSIEPSTVSINRDGNIYTFTQDIQASIFVEKDNIVIDGAGFTLQGIGANEHWSSIPEYNITEIMMGRNRNYDETIIPESNNTGIYSNAQKLTITNLEITEFWCAIELEYSSDNQIINNNLTNNNNGIVIFSSSNNTIARNIITNVKQGITLTAAHNNIYANKITNSSEYGIKLEWSFNNITENTITNSNGGIIFSSAKHNFYRNNNFIEVNHIFGVTGSSFQEYLQDFDDSNTVNGKPIRYWVNKQDLTVPIDSGWVTLVNCTRIRVENLNLEAGQKISLISTTNSTVTNNLIVNNQVCIFLDESTNNTIEKNTLTDSEYGIQLTDSSTNHIIGNNITGNNKGIELIHSTKNTILQNQIRMNNLGIRMLECKSNIISGNNLATNVQGIYLERTPKFSLRDPYNSTVVSACSDNLFSENNIIKNNFGIWMCSASNNTFSGNNFINNTNHLKMEDSLDISVYINHQWFLYLTLVNQTNSEQTTPTFPNNTTNPVIIEFPSINFWDDNKKGNYWSNYTNTDNNNDGIGDTPYAIDENNQDNYPLMVANVTPNFSYGKETVTPNYWVIVIAGVGALIIILGAASFKLKKKATS